MNSFIDLPERRPKPRETGITSLLDNGIPTRLFEDTVRSFHTYIDYIKFGWGSCLITEDIDRKIELCRSRNIDFYFGGSLFEKAYYQKKLDQYIYFCEDHKCSVIEISNGTVDISSKDKIRFIREFAKSFIVFSEVGYKDNRRSIHMHPSRWVECITEDLEAGAQKVVTESRENGKGGICRENGELRFGLIIEILEHIDSRKLIFEAPNRQLQTYFIGKLDQNVNLGNIPFSSILGLETLRLGLRADTLVRFEPPEGVRDGNT